MSNVSMKDIDYCLDIVNEELCNGKLSVADEKSALIAVAHFRRLIAIRRLEKKLSYRR